MSGICNYLLACWRPSATTACNSGYHEPGSANSFDPSQNANQVAALQGETSSSSEAFQALRQPERAKLTEREVGTMRSLIQTIFPIWQTPRTHRELSQLTDDYNRLALSLRHTRSELQQANSELEQAHSELHRANDEVRQLNDSVHDCQKELKACRSEISKLQNKERSMRDFLIENSHNQIVSDRDVCERFTQLRQRIQRLASNKAYDIEDFHHITLDGKWFQGRYIESLWNVSPKSGRLAILRSLLFQFLHDHIFNLLHFDINDKKTSPYLAELRSPFPDLSQPLSFFERIIGDCAVNRDILINWRLSTFKCIDAAGLGGSDAGVAFGDLMFNYFQEFTSQKATPQQISKLRNGYRELCKEAWSLQLLMRNSLEPFECFVSPGCRLKGLEDRYEAIGEISHVPGTVGDFAFPIFGALIKHNKVNGESVKVLEKAQCIMAVPST